MSEYYLALPKLPDVEDPKLYNLLEPVYLAIHSVGNNFLYSCGTSRIAGSEYSRLNQSPALVQPHNLNRLIVTAAEALAFGSLVNLALVGSVVKASLAKGGPTDAKRAMGYCNVPGGVAADALVEIIVGTGLLGVSGATVGTVYYLGTTAGTISTSAPGSGLVQYVGVGILPDQVYLSLI